VTEFQREVWERGFPGIEEWVKETFDAQPQEWKDMLARSFCVKRPKAKRKESKA